MVQSGRHTMLVASGLGEVATAAWFDVGEWQRAGAVALETSGRGTVLVVEHAADKWVLRHYRRGGLVSQFVEDHYLWFGLERTRAFREWRLLLKLRSAGLPVPKPIAAHVYRTGLIYTADIITGFLPDTRKLSWYIAQGRVSADTWTRIGRMIKAVHDYGVDHPDLTAHNILLDSAGAVFLVDFDNAQIRPSGTWQKAGMDRLQRSLRKVALETGTEFDGTAWRYLQQAYEQPHSAA